MKTTINAKPIATITKRRRKIHRDGVKLLLMVNPDDGVPVDLFVSADALAKGTNALQKDFSQFYGVTSSGEVFFKREAEDKLVNYFTPYKGMSDEQVILENTIVNPTLTDDLKKKDAALKELGMRLAAKMILAKTDDAFAKAKQEALAAFKKASAEI